MDAHTRNVFHPCLVLCLVPPTQSFLHILPEFLMYLPFLLHKKYIIATDQYVALLMIFSHMEETSVTESLLSFRAAWSSVSLYPNSFNLHSPIDRHWTLFPNIFYYQQHCSYKLIHTLHTHVRIFVELMPKVETVLGQTIHIYLQF